MTILSLEQASFAVGHVPLLNHTSFQLHAGEKIGLIGRNGAGKSSLLKILAGIQKPDEGQLITQNNLKTVYVPQESSFNPNDTVFTTVAAGLGHIHDLLNHYHQISHQLENQPNNPQLIKALNDLQNQIETNNGWQLNATITQTISELELPEHTPITQLSGGQKKRLALAQAWVQKPDILLLDEPTNHLDIDAIIWLENLLQQFSGSLIVITHDRRFLDHVANRIIELDRGILRSYPGNFAQYSHQKAQEIAIETEHNRLFDKFHAQEEAWIRKGIEARRTRNEGRVKRLEELRRQRAERRERQGQISLQLDTGEKSGKIIAEFEHASFQYHNQIIMQDFSCTIQRGDKIGLIGRNGIGKTTFLKLILGELAPTQGNIKLGSKQKVAYFDQFRSSLNENDTIFYTLGQGNDYVEIAGKRKHIISYLEDFLFHPARAQSPVSSLSGGERNRLLLAKLFTRPANILVLDEPTNDLDIDTQELLEEKLRDYQGTVFIVSHDRTFLDNVITQSIVFQENGKLKEYIGGYQDYLDAYQREQHFQAATIATPATQNPEKSKPKSNRSIKLSYNEQRELERLPNEITTLETEQNELNQQLSNPNIFKDYQHAAKLQTRAEEIEQQLLAKLERWEYLENKHNQTQ